MFIVLKKILIAEFNNICFWWRPQDINIQFFYELLRFPEFHDWRVNFSYIDRWAWEIGFSEGFVEGGMRLFYWCIILTLSIWTWAAHEMRRVHAGEFFCGARTVSLSLSLAGEPAAPEASRTYQLPGVRIWLVLVLFGVFPRAPCRGCFIICWRVWQPAPFASAQITRTICSR